MTSASIMGLVSTDNRAGRRVRRVLSDPSDAVRTGPLCFASSGFSLHAATRISAGDKAGLEKLCKYVSSCRRTKKAERKRAAKEPRCKQKSDSMGRSFETNFSVRVQLAARVHVKPDGTSIRKSHVQPEHGGVLSLRGQDANSSCYHRSRVDQTLPRRCWASLRTS